MNAPNMTSPNGVMEWANDHSFGAGAPAVCDAIAKAMRYKAVWEQHRDKLSHLANPSRYATINRVSLNKGIQAFLHAMNRAEAGDGPSKL